jgi:hypothetical protein
VWTRMNQKLYKKFGEFKKSDILKADSYKELMDKIHTRLNEKYSSSKVKWIWRIQNAFDNCDYIELDDGNYELHFHELYVLLNQTIKWKAEALERRYKYVRLSYHDFEAKLWEITYDAIEYYDSNHGLDTEFTLLETLELFWKYRMKDYIKSCLFTKKHSPWYTASSLADNFDGFWNDELPIIEGYKDTVEGMFNDSDLSENERQLLEEIYNNPEGSLRDWGKEIGITHPQTVKRLYQSLQKKLEKYRNSFL